MIFDRQTQLGLIRGILAEPDEDAPSLVYADWLEEQGDPFGEVVRVQIELRRVGLARRRREELERRERELLDGLGFDRAPIPARDFHGTFWAMGDGWDYCVCEGLATLFIHNTLRNVGGLVMPPPEWVERFGWFFLRGGWYDSYEYRYELGDPMMEALLASPLMDHCIGLDLTGVKRWYGAMKMLASSPAAAGLLRLGLGESDLGPDDLLALANSPHLAGLLDLDVSTNYLGDEAIPALSASKALPELRRLRLSNVRASAESITALVKSPHFPHLRSLDVSHNPLSAETVSALADGTGMANLVELNVSYNDALTNEGALALIRSPKLPHLRRLGLAGTRIGAATIETLGQTDRFFRCGELRLEECAQADEPLAALARSPHAALLRVLVARGTVHTDAGAKALAASPHLKGLVNLDLSRCRIGPEGAAALTDSGVFPQLDELTLRNNPISNLGALALARWARERGETNLHLGAVGLTAAGVVELVRSGALAGLVCLVLDENAIGDVALAVLARCPDLLALRDLRVNDVGMTDAGALALVESPYLPREADVWAFDHPDLSAAAIQALEGRFAKVWH